MVVKVTNNAWTSLTGNITEVDTIIPVTAVAKFPTVGAGDYFYGTLIDSSNNLEIIKVTSLSGLNYTVERGAEGTTPRAYLTTNHARLELRVTAQTVVDLYAQNSIDAAASAAAALVSQNAVAADLILTDADTIATAASAAAALASQNAAAASAAGVNLPAIIGGDATKHLQVNVGETAYELVAGKLPPIIVGGDALKFLRVNAGETAYETAGSLSIPTSYLADIIVELYALKHAWVIGGELVNSSQTTAGKKFTISEDGLQAVIARHSSTDSIYYRYNLSIPWDVSSATYATDTITLSGNVIGIQFNSAPAAAIQSINIGGGAGGSVDSITVNGVHIMSGSVAYTVSAEATADAVAANINTHTSSPNYYAQSVGGGTLTITAAVGGASPNGFAVVSSVTGPLTAVVVGTEVMERGGGIGTSLLLRRSGDGALLKRYFMTAAYDISTATEIINDETIILSGTFVKFSHDGLKCFTYDLNGGNDRIEQFTLQSPFAPTSATTDSIYLDISAEVGSGTVTGIDVSVDGLYVMVLVGSVTYRYDLITPNVLTGGTYSGERGSAGDGSLDLQMSPNGVRMYKQDANGLSQVNTAPIRYRLDY